MVALIWFRIGSAKYCTNINAERLVQMEARYVTVMGGHLCCLLSGCDTVLPDHSKAIGRDLHANIEDAFGGAVHIPTPAGDGSIQSKDYFGTLLDKTLISETA